MITTSEEYNSLLPRLKNPNKFIDLFCVPEDEPVYDIDLNSRTITAPQFVSVQFEHNAEIIWFKADRFYDNIDLYRGSCIIQYKDAALNEFYYAAPIVTGTEKYGNEVILIPWVISERVSSSPGVIYFAFQFFKLSEDNTKYQYVLNTQVAKSKILTGMQVDSTNDLEQDNGELTVSQQNLLDRIRELENAYTTLSKDYVLYWVEDL